jgi:GTP-binding protein
LANFYRVELEGAGGPGRLGLYLVDLPGYGYARGGADAARELQEVAEAFFRSRDSGLGTRDSQERPRPERGAGGKPGKAGPPSESERVPASSEKSGARAALLLVDARHPGLEADIRAARWLDSMGVRRHIVATKIDKLSRSERARNLKAIGDTFGMAALPVSAASGEGLDELWRMIVRIARDADRDG